MAEKIENLEPINGSLEFAKKIAELNEKMMAWVLSQRQSNELWSELVEIRRQIRLNGLEGHFEVEVDYSTPGVEGRVLRDGRIIDRNPSKPFLATDLYSLSHHGIIFENYETDEGFVVNGRYVITLVPIVEVNETEEKLAILKESLGQAGVSSFMTESSEDPDHLEITFEPVES